MKQTKPFFVSTSEKRHRDKMQREKLRTPGSILEQVKQRQITARSQFESSPSQWLNPPMFDSSKPTFKKKRSTPKPIRDIYDRPNELAAYKSMLTNASLFKLNRTPIFSRNQQQTPPSAISRSYLGRSQENSTIQRSFLKNLEKYKKKSPKKSPEIILEESLLTRPSTYPGEDRDVIEIVDMISPKRSPKKAKSPEIKKNTLMEEMKIHEVFKEDYVTDLMAKYNIRKSDRDVLIREEKTKVAHAEEYSARLAKSVEERMKKHLSITEIEIPEPEPEPESEDEAELPELTDEMEDEINGFLSSPNGQTLVDAHNIAITRKDLDTLRGLNWLNDEIINFYLQMIVAR